jgi:hypothetical protein
LPKTHRVAALAATALAAALAPATALAAPPTSTGPSTTTSPYVVPVADGVSVTSLLTVGDDGAATNGYEMTGIPDGLGAFGLGGGSFGLIMNHEIGVDSDTGAVLGVPRAHGFAGAFASKLRIDRKTLEVEEGEDLVQPGTEYWDYLTSSYGSAPGAAGTRADGKVFEAYTAEFLRWCSGTLTDSGQLYNPRTGNGTRERIYFGNEENGDEGRTFGVSEDGHAKQLPRLGLFSWENTVPAYNRNSDTTLVMGQEDRATGQPWVYVGKKTDDGDVFDRAGLTNGTNYVVDVVDEAVSTDAEFRTTYGKGVEADVDLSEVDWNQSGADQNAEAEAEGLTLNRIEDGVWDPRPGHHGEFYFTTTEGGAGATDERDGGGLWRLSFEDKNDPLKGATLELLLDGSEAPLLYKPDNLGIDRHGNLLIQEDPGGDPFIARIVAYDVDSGDTGVVAQFDPERFAPGGSAFITDDEESSGIVDARRYLGRGWFLFDAQVHEPSGDPATVELGQLLALHVKDFDDVYDAD